MRPHDESDSELLARIDERVNQIHEKLPKFVTMDRFGPVEKIAYGLVTLICIAVAGSILSNVIK